MTLLPSSFLPPCTTRRRATSPGDPAPQKKKPRLPQAGLFLLKTLIASATAFTSRQGLCLILSLIRDFAYRTPFIELSVEPGHLLNSSDETSLVIAQLFIVEPVADQIAKLEHRFGQGGLLPPSGLDALLETHRATGLLPIKVHPLVAKIARLNLIAPEFALKAVDFVLQHLELILLICSVLIVEEGEGA